MSTIQSNVVPDSERMSFLPWLAGIAFAPFENSVYSWADNLSENYDGGFWEFVRCENNTGYLVPTSRETFRVNVAGNGFEGEMTAGAFGIVVTLFALNALSFAMHDKGDFKLSELFADRYHALLEFADQHPESSSIFGAID